MQYPPYQLEFTGQQNTVDAGMEPDVVFMAMIGMGLEGIMKWANAGNRYCGIH